MKLLYTVKAIVLHILNHLLSHPVSKDISRIDYCKDQENISNYFMPSLLLEVFLLSSMKLKEGEEVGRVGVATNKQNHNKLHLICVHFTSEVVTLEGTFLD